MNDQNQSSEFEGVKELKKKVKHHEKKLSERLSYTDEVVFVVLLLIFSGAIIMSTASGFPTEFSPAEETTTISDEEKVSQEKQNSIEGDIIEVVIDDEKAEPFRPRISKEDGVRFVNDASYDLRFEFNRELETFTLEKGDKREVNPTVIMYYTVNTVDENVDFREINGGINVQG